MILNYYFNTIVLPAMVSPLLSNSAISRYDSYSNFTKKKKKNEEKLETLLNTQIVSTNKI